jgi:hypothetical protein
LLRWWQNHHQTPTLFRRIQTTSNRKIQRSKKSNLPVIQKIGDGNGKFLSTHCKSNSKPQVLHFCRNGRKNL